MPDGHCRWPSSEEEETLHHELPLTTKSFSREDERPTMAKGLGGSGHRKMAPR